MMIFPSRANPWVDAFDFLPRKPRNSVWGWALLVVGLMAALHVAEQWHRLDLATHDQQASLQRLERAARQVERTQSQAVGALASDVVWTADSQQQAHRVLRLLAFPWPDVLDQVELAAAQEGVLMLSLAADIQSSSASGANTTIRLSGAVSEDAVALSWAQALGAEAQLTGRAPLSASIPSAKGNLLWRADVTWARSQP